MKDLSEFTIKEAREALDKKEIKSIDIVNAIKDKIAQKNKNLNAYLEVFDDLDRQAEEADKKIEAGDKSPLLGIPLAIKDNILIEGRRASAASKILENYIAPYNATAVNKLLNAGAILVGRANMDEFAMGGSTENSAFGVTKNPYDESRVAGGSSGGSAVAVSMSGALGALGSDTGGSIRQPASFCGVVGLKPTYGSVSRYGLMAMASSLDVIGPITKTVEDAEIIFNTIKGKDIMDSTSAEAEVQIEGKVKIGVPRSFLEGVDKDVLEEFEKSLLKLKDIGCDIVDVSMPHLPLSLAVYYILMPAEVSSNMMRYDGIKYGLKEDGQNVIEDYFKTRGKHIGKEVRRRIILGSYVLSTGYYDAYYGKANVVRDLITDDFLNAFANITAIAMPVSPTPAFKIGEKSNDPLQMYLSDVFTVSANLSGIPAISIPAGQVDREGKMLPVGLQLLAPHFGESILFEIGKKFEKI